MQMPIIRLEIENMKHQMLHYFSDHNKEVERVVAAEFDRVIANYPFTERVKEIANNVLREAIEESVKDYVLYGKGRQEINNIISNILDGVFEKEKEGKE